MPDVPPWIEIPDADGNPVRVATGAVSPEWLARRQPSGGSVGDAAKLAFGLATNVRPLVNDALASPTMASTLGTAAKAVGGAIEPVTSAIGSADDHVREAAGALANSAADIALPTRHQRQSKVKADAKSKTAPDPLTAQLGDQAPLLAQTTPQQTSGGFEFKPHVPQASDTERMVRTGMDQQQAAAMKSAEIGAAKAAEEFGYRQEALKQSAELETKRQQMVGEYQRYRDDGMKKMEQLVGEFSKIDTTVNPDRYWANNSTGDRVFAAIAVGLGGLGKGPNQAAQILQGEIQKDIEAQKASIDGAMRKTGASIDGQKTLLGMMRQNFGDDLEAQKATEVALLTQTQARIESLASKYGGQDIAAKAEALHGQLEAAKGQAIAELRQRRDENAIKWANLGLQARELGMKAAASGGKDPDTYVPGVGYAANKEFAKDVAEVVTVSENVKDLIGRLRDLRLENGMELVGGDVEAGKTMAEDLMTLLLREKKLGSLDAGSQAVLKNLAGGDPSRFGFYLSKLDALEKGVDDRVKQTLKFRMRSYDPGAKASEVVKKR